MRVTREKKSCSLAARVERHSQHPLALAVVECAAQNSRAYENFVDDFEILPGRGVRSWNDDTEILVGNELLLEEYGVPLAQRHGGEAQTLMFVAHERRLVGAIGVAATVRPEAIDSIRRLKKIGVERLIMLTGDSEPVARAVADELGLVEWRSRLLPQDKFDAIQELREQGRKVAMVGDGINDAPALALADVGIAMGTAGSDVAIETADIALAADDLRGVSSVVRLSRQTMSVIRQNYGSGHEFDWVIPGRDGSDQSNHRGGIAQLEHDPGHRELHQTDPL